MPMSVDIIPFRFSIDSATLAGATLWALALYVGFSSVSNWVIVQLNRWFNFAERFLYTSATEFERTRKGRESQNAFLASLFSIVPFLIMGGIVEYWVELSLGRSWAVSVGILACISCGVYELGRRTSQNS
jgi:hypothetical protein